MIHARSADSSKLLTQDWVDRGGVGTGVRSVSQLWDTVT